MVTLRKSNIGKESKWFDKEAYDKSRLESATTQQNGAVGPNESLRSEYEDSEVHSLPAIRSRTQLRRRPLAVGQPETGNSNLSKAEASPAKPMLSSKAETD